jgi:D-alanyl-D-alanine carboxypeptidase (penicillin-binding protein 5/6)
MASDKERAEEARKMLEWGMVGFSRTPLFATNDIIGQVSVYGGDKTTVALRAKGPIAIPLPRSADEKLAARIVYKGPVVAPVKAGDRIGSLNVWLGDTLAQETPLYAAVDVPAGSFHQRAWAATRELAIGWLR